MGAQAIWHSSQIGSFCFSSTRTLAQLPYSFDTMSSAMTMTVPASAAPVYGTYGGYSYAGATAAPAYSYGGAMPAMYAQPKALYSQLAAYSAPVTAAYTQPYTQPLVAAATAYQTLPTTSSMVAYPAAATYQLPSATSMVAYPATTATTMATTTTTPSVVTE